MTKSAAVDYLMKKNGIEVFRVGQLTSLTEVTVTSDRKDEKIEPSISIDRQCTKTATCVKIDGKRFVTSDEVLELKTPPKSLLVLAQEHSGVRPFTNALNSLTLSLKCSTEFFRFEDDDVSVEMAKL